MGGGSSTTAARAGGGSGTSFEAKRRDLFKESGESHFSLAVAEELKEHPVKRYSSVPNLQDLPDLHFLYHAWGYVPPVAMQKAMERQYVLYTKYGNFTWDVVFGNLLQDATMYVKKLLHVDDHYLKQHHAGVINTSMPSANPHSTSLVEGTKYTVEFGHNSHELISRIFSTTFDRILASSCHKPLTIVTTDTEFYSMTRQINRLSEINSDRINIVVVKVQPIHSFQNRLCEEIEKQHRIGHAIDFVYVSQITFLQHTVIADIRSFVPAVRNALEKNGPPTGGPPGTGPIVIVDGYHSFGAFDISLHGLDCIFVAGALKHIGAGPNLAFVVYPDKYASMRPASTGWLADVSVLGPGSAGISVGSSVAYTPGLSLMGSTPSFTSSVILFNEVMALWKSHQVDLHFVHQHVMAMQKRFLDGLAHQRISNHGNKYINMTKIVKTSRFSDDPSDLRLEDESVRSHTLVFEQASAADAAEAVSSLADHRIACDCRKVYVRLGFGLKHNPEDVDRLLKALEYNGHNENY